MRYLLDTAPWVNAATNPELLPPKILALLRGGEIKGLSSVSLMECAAHHRKGRLEIHGDLRDFFKAALSAEIELLDVTPEIAATSNELPKDFPGDPFDRTIAATARVHRLTLITSDEEIRDAKFCAVEFYRFRPSRSR